MVEKTVITALIGIFATVGYAEVADHSEEILQEASAVAAVMQEREIRNALEIYWLDNKAYPNVEDEEVVSVLQKADLLEGDEMVFDVDYELASSDQKYKLEVS